MITLGNEDNITLKVGTETVVAVYMGTEQVYPDTPTPQYRWVETGEYECGTWTGEIDGDAYIDVCAGYPIEKKQVSYDSGSTWADVSPSETRTSQTPVIDYSGCCEPSPINWTPIDYITCSDLIEKMRFQGNPPDIANLSDIAISQTACGTYTDTWNFSDIMNYLQPDGSFVIDFMNEILFYPSIVSLRGFPRIDTLERLKTEALNNGIIIDVVINQ